MRNSEAAAILYEIADLLEMQNVEFKPQAYRKAARSIEELSDDVAEIWKKRGRDGLKGINGVGEGIAVKLEEFLKTGKLRYYEDLKKRFPAHISALMEVPGLGPKKIRVLNEKLGIRDIKELEDAAKSHKIAGLRGFGEKTEQDILDGLELVKKGIRRSLLGNILPVAREIEARLGSLGFVRNAVVAGSFRRRQETVGDIDVLATSRTPAKVSEFFVSMPEVKDVVAKGRTKSTVVLNSGLQVDLRVVQEKSFGSALQYFSGDIRHNIRLREIAISKGYKLNEYGVFDKKGRQLAGKTEQDVYRVLGLDYIEPELRTDHGEIEAAMEHRLPKLIQYGSVKGDLHTHTKKTDGTASLEEMVEAAKRMGREYIAITDHSVSERIASGLDEEKMDAWLKEIKDFSRKVNGIMVLAGSEVTIRPDGSLDFSDGLLRKMDVVVASVHSRFKSGREEMTKRIVRALSNENVDIFGHPTGRLIHRREPYDVDLKAVVKAAVENSVALEINSQPDRLDLKDIHIREAKEFGAKFVINTDAHSTRSLGYMELGVAMARRGWLHKEDVVNTLPFKELHRFFRKMRG